MIPTSIADSRAPTKATNDALHARDTGEGEPLVLLHGLGMTGEAFRFLTPHLAETCRLIVPDLRGHGGSTHLPGPCTTEAMAADLVPSLDALGIDSAHILGHSHGGAIAQVFARMHPERVRSLVLVSTYAVQRVTWWQQIVGHVTPEVITRLGTRQMAWLVYRLRPAGGGRHLSAQAAVLAASMLAANNRRCLRDAMHKSGRFDSRAWLGTLRIPTLVIAGDADCIIVPRQAEDLVRGIPGASLQMLNRAGHALPLSHPDELSRLITRWLNRVDHDQPHFAFLTLPDRLAHSARTSQQRSWPGYRSGRVQVVAIPREHTLDSSLALLKEGYTFVGNRSQRFGSDFSRPSLERPEVRVRALSRAMTAETWLDAVWWLMYSAAAISRSDAPATSRAGTSCCLGASSTRAAGSAALSRLPVANIASMSEMAASSSPACEALTAASSR